VAYLIEAILVVEQGTYCMPSLDDTTIHKSYCSFLITLKCCPELNSRQAGD